MAKDLNENALITVLDIQTYFKQEADDQELIIDLINRASTAIETFCNNHFIIRASALTEVYDGDGSAYLILRKNPIVTLTTVKYKEFDGTDGDTLTEGSDFKKNSQTGELYSASVWTEGFQNISVTYTAGLQTATNRANLPEDLKQACIKLVEYWFKRDVADYSTTFEEGSVVNKPQEHGIPKTIQRLLGAYRNIRVNAV